MFYCVKQYSHKEVIDIIKMKSVPKTQRECLLQAQKLASAKKMPVASVMEFNNDFQSLKEMFLAEVKGEEA